MTFFPPASVLISGTINQNLKISDRFYLLFAAYGVAVLKDIHNIILRDFNSSLVVNLKIQIFLMGNLGIDLLSLNYYLSDILMHIL